MAEEPSPVNEEDLKELKKRMNMIAEADPAQYHNDYSLRRYLRAFKTVDNSFQAILKTNKWRVEYGVADLPNNKEIIEKYSEKARVLRHRDIVGRPIIYIPAKNHSSSDRDIDDLTKFIVYCLEDASKRCFEEVVDNLCIVFDLSGFTLSCMDYQVLKNLIWLLSRHYPERLGICLIINAPAFFSGCWAVIKGWNSLVIGLSEVMIDSISGVFRVCFHTVKMDVTVVLVKPQNRILKLLATYYMAFDPSSEVYTIK